MIRKILTHDLFPLLRAKLESMGFDRRVSEQVAALMIESEIRGFTQHGVCRLAQLDESVRNGTVATTFSMTEIRDTGAIAVFDGHNSLGYCTSPKAMEIAIRKAKKFGIGLVGVLNASHIGVLSCYSALASAQGCVGFAFTTSSPAVVLPGGRRKLFGTNPISYSLPGRRAVTADFSTSMVSRGRIMEAGQKGEQLPAEWGVDKFGNLSRVPSEVLEGGIRTLDGGIKGGLLSLIVSVLAGPLIGGEINSKVVGTRYMHQSPNKGDLFIAIDVTQLTDYESFCGKIEQMCAEIAEDGSLFRIPGARHKAFDPEDREQYIELEDETFFQEMRKWEK